MQQAYNGHRRAKPTSLDDLRPGDRVRHAQCGFSAIWPGHEEAWAIDAFWDGAEKLRCPVCEDHEPTAYGGWHRVTTPRRRKPKEEWVETADPELFTTFAKLPPDFARACHLLGLKSSRRWLLVVLWPRQARGGTCRPGLQTIVDETGLSKQTVVDSIADLEARGLLAVTRGREGQRQAVNEYDLTPFWVKVAEILRVQNVSSENGAAPAVPASDDADCPPEGSQSPEDDLSEAFSGSKNGDSQSPIRCLEVEGVEGEGTSTPREGLASQGRAARATGQTAPLEGGQEEHDQAQDQPLRTAGTDGEPEPVPVNAPDPDLRALSDADLVERFGPYFQTYREARRRQIEAYGPVEPTP
jgi:hypothetical protein